MSRMLSKITIVIFIVTSLAGGIYCAVIRSTSIKHAVVVESSSTNVPEIQFKHISGVDLCLVGDIQTSTLTTVSINPPDYSVVAIRSAWDGLVVYGRTNYSKRNYTRTLRIYKDLQEVRALSYKDGKSVPLYETVCGYNFIANTWGPLLSIPDELCAAIEPYDYIAGYAASQGNVSVLACQAERALLHHFSLEPGHENVKQLTFKTQHLDVSQLLQSEPIRTFTREITVLKDQLAPQTKWDRIPEDQYWFIGGDASCYIIYSWITDQVHILTPTISVASEMKDVIHVLEAKCGLELEVKEAMVAFSNDTMYLGLKNKKINDVVYIGAFKYSPITSTFKCDVFGTLHISNNSVGGLEFVDKTLLLEVDLGQELWVVELE